MILADSSVWRTWLKSRTPDPDFTRLVAEREIACHPWILGELLLGGLDPAIANLIADLDFLPIAPEEEVYKFIRLYRPKGVGWVDVNLLVSCIDGNVPLWTNDQGLRDNASRFGRSLPG